MALISIRTTDGRAILVHSSIFGPQSTRPQSTGLWEDVWRRVDESLAPPREPPHLGSA